MLRGRVSLSVRGVPFVPSVDGPEIAGCVQLTLAEVPETGPLTMLLLPESAEFVFDCVPPVTAVTKVPPAPPPLLAWMCPWKASACFAPKVPAAVPSEFVPLPRTKYPRRSGSAKVVLPLPTP